MKMKPSQSSLRDASSPEERAFRHLAVTLPKPPPFGGGGCERSEQTEGVLRKSRKIKTKESSILTF